MTLRCVLALVAATVLLRPIPVSAQTHSIDRGRLLVQRHCAACHAIRPTGDSSNPAAPKFRDLHLRYPIDALAEALAEGIIVGHPEMPQFQLDPGQVDDVIGYLKSIQTREPRRLAPQHPRSTAG